MATPMDDQGNENNYSYQKVKITRIRLFSTNILWGTYFSLLFLHFCVLSSHFAAIVWKWNSFEMKILQAREDFSSLNFRASINANKHPSSFIWKGNFEVLFVTKKIKCPGVQYLALNLWMNQTVWKAGQLKNSFNRSILKGIKISRL